MNNEIEASKSLFKHCDLYSLMCVIFELNQHIPFQDELENSIFAEQQLENNTRLNLLYPNINFYVPDKICNIIQSKYKGCLGKIKNKENNQEDLWYCFSPSKKWENYKTNENSNGYENYDKMLEEIIQNLFNIQFNINSIMQTKYYKTISSYYKKILRA
jgi:hypothetical protein